MLVLSRKVGEKVRIGDDIELTVIEVRGEAVRLGIFAPRGVPIYRQELLDAVREENRVAAGVKPPAAGRQAPGELAALGARLTARSRESAKAKE
jgi:carbon storage regulator